MALLAGLGVLLGAGPARADAPFGDATVDLGSADTPWSVHVSDLDGDGDLDVLSASQADDEVNWYENDGASPPSFTPHTLGTMLDGPSAVTTADLDRDGDLDAIATGILIGEVGWYENDGASPPAFTAHVIDTQAPAARGVFAADLDGDGDPDVLVASEGADEIIWYESDAGSPPSFTRHSITTAADGATSVSAADLDGDGDLDVLSTSENDNTLAWYESDGASPPSFTRRLIFTDGQAALGHSTADLDGDGDLDVALASTIDNMISWFENDGASPPGWIGRVITLGAMRARAVVTADLDGDGDIDVASASEFDDTVAWYENDGASPPSFTVHQIFTGALGASSVDTGDLDGDGDLDLISASFNDNHIRWYPNESIHHGLAFGARSVVSGGVGKAASVVAVDLDRDGAPDLLSAALGADSVLWHESDGSSPPAFAQTVLATGVDGANALASADLDRDGAPDVIAAAGFGAEIVWLDSDGASPPSFTQRSVSQSLAAVSAVEVADLDGDGAPDVIGAVFVGATLHWFQSDGAGTPAFSAQVLSVGLTGTVDVEAADLDADGDLDVVSAHNSDDTFAWHENDGSGPTGFTTRVLDAASVGAAAVRVVDRDGDGDLDVLAVSKGDDTVAWFESDGAADPGFTRRVVSISAAGAEDIDAFDFDRDGDLDIAVARSVTGTVAVYKSDGGAPPTFSAALSLPAATGVRTLAVRDLDRDGRVDLAAGSASDDTVAWYRNLSGQLDFRTEATPETLILQGTEAEVLKIVATHLGRAGDGDAEVAAIALRFESPAGVAMSDAAFNALVDTVSIYADTNDSGELEIGTDPAVSVFGGLKELSDGVLVLMLPDGASDVRVVLGSPEAFFVTLLMTGTGAGEPVNTLRSVHVPDSGTLAEDRDHDIALRLVETSNAPSPMMQVVVALPPCADGSDNDGDLLTDFPDDPGCKDASFASVENPECDDGVDNDIDTFTDHPDDPQCEAPWWDDESMGKDNRTRCGLGAELALLLPLLGWLRARRRREAALTR